MTFKISKNNAGIIFNPKKPPVVLVFKGDGHISSCLVVLTIFPHSVKKSFSRINFVNLGNILLKKGFLLPVI